MGYNLDSIRKKYAKLKAEQAQRGVVRWLQDGRNVFRILPPEDPKDPEEMPFHVGGNHWRVGPGGRSENCLRLFKGEACPACEVSEELFKTGEPQDRRLAKQLRPRTQYFFNVIFRGEEEAGPKWLRVPETVFNGIMSYFGDEVEPVDISDPKNGFDVVVTKAGSGLKTTYDTKCLMKSSRLGTPAQVKAWQEARLTWNDFLAEAVLTYDAFSALLSEGDVLTSDADDGDDEDDEDDEERQPRPRLVKKTKKKGKPKPAPEPEEEDEEEEEPEPEEEDDEEEEEEPEPEEEDDEEEEEPEEEEEETPPPPKKRKKKTTPKAVRKPSASVQAVIDRVKAAAAKKK